jgi:hypothetical protein
MKLQYCEFFIYINIPSKSGNTKYAISIENEVFSCMSQIVKTEICLLNDDEFDEYVQEGLRDNEEVNHFHDFLPRTNTAE